MTDDEAAFWKEVYIVHLKMHKDAERSDTTRCQMAASSADDAVEMLRVRKRAA